VSLPRFAAALETSASHALGGAAGRGDRERHVTSLHLEDLALACACADGHEAAWEHFIQTHRPVLYRAADALAPGGGAREIADALYADLFGIREREGERQSLFRYFHGRSSLATWLRAVLSQRYIDWIRAGRRTEPLPEQEGTAHAAPPADPDRPKYLTSIRKALAIALMRLTDRDRLRLSLYYLQDLTLAEVGRILKEHEATVSRQLTRTRSALRKEAEAQLRMEGFTEDEVDRCFASVAADAGPLDLGTLLGGAAACKAADTDRSI
jgi:RNA polymerase sigma-70 factor